MLDIFAFHFSHNVLLRGVRHIKTSVSKMTCDLMMRGKKGQLIFISLVILHRRLVWTLTDQHCCRNEPFNTVQRKTVGERFRVSRAISMSPGVCFGKLNFPDHFFKDLFW